MADRQLVVNGPWQVRSTSERIVDIDVVPFDVVAMTERGPELFRRGAFDDADPAAVALRMDHVDPPAGWGLSIEQHDDRASMSFRVARTPRGDELLANVVEGTERNASIGFVEVDGGTVVERVDGKPTRVHQRVDLREVSTTWRPVYAGASIVSVRSHPEGSDMAAEALANDATNDHPASVSAPAAIAPAAPTHPDADRLAVLMSRLDNIEERSRQQSAMVPADRPAPRALTAHRGRWASMALRLMDGERIPDFELRAAADVITSDNIGVVPKNVQSELVGVIDKSRPFLQSVRNVPAGNAGMTQVFPKITQRPLTGVQLTEKAELASGESAITTVEFGAVTVGGYGDLSMQLLKRSTPDFLALWLDLLAESYAINTDDLAVDALLGAGPIAGGEFDPASPSFGSAFANAAAVGRTMRPNRIWLSTAGMTAFIDAKEPTGGGGRPLYPGLAPIAGVTDTGGGGPEPFSLTPVWVPALDDETVDVIVGPSNGFAYAEDGTYTLQADVPSKFGRDVGLAGILWFMPVYPTAFTTYTLPVVIP